MRRRQYPRFIRRAYARRTGSGPAVRVRIKKSYGIVFKSLERSGMNPSIPKVRFQASDGSIHHVNANQLDKALAIDPQLRVLPPKNPNEFVLSVEDEAFLWGLRIGRE